MSEKINVIWYDNLRGNWDSALLGDIFDSDSRFFQFSTTERIVFDEAIIIMGKPNDHAAVKEHLEKFKRGLIILTSDEDSYFDWKLAIPERHEVWTQYYSWNKTKIKTRILLGYTTKLKDAVINLNQERKYLFSFVGQVQNPHRQKCTEVLWKLPYRERSFVRIASGFGGVNGLDYQEYIDVMCQSKVVICPSGSMSTDSFRAYEALECGALPIVEARCPRDPVDWNYWEETSSGFLTVVKSWDELPEILANESLIAELTEQSQAWWKKYKMDLKNKLLSW